MNWKRVTIPFATVADGAPEGAGACVHDAEALRLLEVLPAFVVCTSVLATARQDVLNLLHFVDWLLWFCQGILEQHF
jgi:hypothetical protein